MDINNYTVTFDPSLPPAEQIKIAPTFPPLLNTPAAPPFPVTVSASITLFTFTLSGPPGATFLSYPVQWSMAPGVTTPDNPPPMFMVHSYDDQHFSIWDYNGGTTTTSHNFFVLVYYDGSIYSGDPTIVNDPPAG